VYPCDVTSESQVTGAAARIVDELDVPDLLVNNAGLFVPGGLLDTSLADFRAQVDTNLTSAFIVTKAFLPAMISKKSGTVVFLGSVASIRAYPGGAAYCAAKHGLLGLARSVREETREHGVRATILMAGATLTPSWEGVDLPADRFIPAADVAAVIRDTWRLSTRTVIEEILIRPQLGDI
jgi:NAD(P)-dependent dehydrogenase (short-subunit alcohol dehydrogenase family)